MCWSDRSTSNTPAPTEWRYTIEQMSLTTDSTSSVPEASEIASHLSARRARAIPSMESRSRLPPLSLYESRMSSISSRTWRLSASGYAYSRGVTQ